MTRAKKVAALPEDLARRVELTESILGHKFTDKSLVQCALTHPSAVEVRDPSAYYERLEFLGDSIVGFVIAEELFRRFPLMEEGGLTKIRVSLVSRTTLGRVASELGLADVIVMGRSESGTGGRGLKSALGNVYEALVAALYLDAGMKAAGDWVVATLCPLISADAAVASENPKSELQERLQAKGEVPVYQLVSQDGPPHARTFTVEVSVAGKLMGSGIGSTKKEAEAAAAAVAIGALAKRRRSRRAKGS